MSGALRAVLFDMGGVLIETGAYDPLRVTANWMAHPAVQDYLGPGFTPEQVAQFCYGYIQEHVVNAPGHVSRDYWTTIREMFLTLTGRPAPYEVLEFNRIAFSEAEDPNLRPIPGAHAALEAVRAGGWRSGLVSNVFHPGLLYRRVLHRTGLLDLLEMTLFSSEFPVRKPHPDIFRHAARLIEVAPEGCLFVGDTFDRDILGAKGVGMSTLWIDRKGRADAETETVTPHVPDTVAAARYLAETR